MANCSSITPYGRLCKRILGLKSQRLVTSPAWCLLLVVGLGAPCIGLTDALRLDGVSVLALAPQSARAVIALPSGRFLRVKPGDILPGLGATVIAVQNDKLVLETAAQQGQTAKQRVWVYPVIGSGRQSRIHYLNKVPPSHPPLRRPAGDAVDLVESKRLVDHD